MLSIAACLAGILAILAIAEILWQYKLLRGELQRKFIHISVGSFMAFWPWFMDWRSIRLISLVILAGVVISRWQDLMHYNDDLGRRTYGDLLFPAAILICSFLTQNKYFFAIAILHMAVADGLAAAIGKSYLKRWKYRVYHHTKTIIGSMVFWFVSLCIFGAALLFAHDYISFHTYILLLVVLPPIVTLLESAPGIGFDNLTVPLAVVLMLNFAQSNL
jgi:phytol kinase